MTDISQNEDVKDNIPQENNVESKEPSLREQIESASKEVNEKRELTKAETKVKTPKSDKVEKAEKTENREKPDKVEKTEEKTVDTKVSTAPNSWTAAAKAKWAELPAEIQAEVAKREAEVEKGFTKFDEERQYGKSIKDIVTPYMPMIAAEGGTPQIAIQSLLNSAYLLRTGTPQAKGQMLLDLARQYGADLSAAMQPQQQIDPQLQRTQQELEQMKQYLQQQESLKQQLQQESIQSTIQTFAANSENVHFESVKADMAALLQAGRAKDLQEAYDMAVWARPDIRSTLLSRQVADAEAKRVAEIKAKSDNARRAAGSIVGNPGIHVPANSNTNRSLRDEITANFREFVS